MTEQATSKVSRHRFTVTNGVLSTTEEARQQIAEALKEGVVPLKAQYNAHKRVKKDSAPPTQQQQDQLSEDSSQKRPASEPAKNARPRKRARGQNKKRAFQRHVIKLCPYIAKTGFCKFGDKCKSVS